MMIIYVTLKTHYGDTVTLKTHYDDTVTLKTHYDDTVTLKTHYGDTVTQKTHYSDTVTLKTHYSDTVTQKTHYGDTVVTNAKLLQVCRLLAPCHIMSRAMSVQRPGLGMTPVDVCVEGRLDRLVGVRGEGWGEG